MRPATNQFLYIPSFFASTLVYILRSVIITSSVGIILLPFVPASKHEQIVWVVPLYSLLLIHRFITYVSQLTWTLSLSSLTLIKTRIVGHGASNLS